MFTKLLCEYIIAEYDGTDRGQMLVNYHLALIERTMGTYNPEYEKLCNFVLSECIKKYSSNGSSIFANLWLY